MPYVLRTDTGFKYPAEEWVHLKKDSRCQFMEGEMDEVIAETPASSDPVREAQILAAVQQIEPENYGKPAGGRPAMPKIAAVEYLTGFKVTTAEILTAMNALKG